MRIVTLLFLTILFNACMLKPPQALQKGSFVKSDKIDTLNLEIRNRLIFLEVEIKSKKYKFLFDTGAPFCISQKLQDEIKFKVISKGRIIDSDKNKANVNYVRIDSVLLGSKIFLNQTAFVADLEANPIIKCYGIDGIIGSNLMRHADWLIDSDHSQILISEDLSADFKSSAYTVPFTTDMQYNILFELALGALKLNPITLDYGSNGGIDLSKHHFHQVEHQHIIENSKAVLGEQQSGLLGNAIPSEHKISISDSLKIGSLVITDSELQIGGNDILGNQILLKMLVGIDWSERKLYFKKASRESTPFQTFGFYVGHKNEKELYVRSVFEGTDAFEKGIKSGMEILMANNLDFRKDNTLCDYVDLANENPSTINLLLLDEEGKEISFILETTNLRD